MSFGVRGPESAIIRARRSPSTQRSTTMNRSVRKRAAAMLWMWSRVIAASAHVCTARFVALVEDALAGHIAESRAHHEALLPVVQSCFTEPNPAVFKGVLHAQGLIPTPDLRLPMTNASDGAVARALAAIDAAS